MLSNQDIQRAMDAGELVITPFDQDMLRGTGVTLHLGYDLLKPLPGKVVDVKNKIVPDFKELKISLEAPYHLEPGEFLLAATFESVTVGSSLGFLIEGRSTLARVGLTIVQTAMLVYPGHSNRPITLELANHGPNTILLYPKMKIARVVLMQLKTPATVVYDAKGKYRGQRTVGRPIFEDEIKQ